MTALISCVRVTISCDYNLLFFAKLLVTTLLVSIAIVYVRSCVSTCILASFPDLRGGGGGG